MANGKLNSGTVSVTLASNVSAKSLHDLLDKIITRHGCTACGLLGIDLHFRGGDPELKEFQTIAGIQDVRILPTRAQ